MPDALAGLAASAALAVSDIPFGGPISEVRVARINGQFVIDPTFEQLEKADMDLMVAATYDNIMMVEGEMDEVSEQDLLAAMKAAHDAIKIHCKAQMELMEEVGSTVKREYCHEENDEELRKAVHDACYEKAYAIAASGNRNKHERQDAFDAIREEFKAQYTEEELDYLLKALSETDAYGTVLRSKGIIQMADGSWKQFDMVPEEYEVREGQADYTGRVCVIGTDLKEEDLIKLFHI